MPRSRRLLLPLFSSLLIALCACLAFWGRKPLVLLTATPCAAILFYGLLSRQRKRQISRARRDILTYLQFLGCHLSAGLSLRNSLFLSAGDAAAGKSKRSHMRGDYQKVQAALKSRRSLDEIIELLGKIFPCPESFALFSSLKLERHLGKNLPTTLQSVENSARELVRLDNELQAANARNNSEGLILSCLPFLMAALFRRFTTFTQTGLAIRNQNLALGAAFVLTLAALGLHFVMSGESRKKSKMPPCRQILLTALAADTEQKKANPFAKVMMRLSEWMACHLPESLNDKVLSSYRLVHPEYYFELTNTGKLPGYFTSLPRTTRAADRIPESVSIAATVPAATASDHNPASANPLSAAESTGIFVQTESSLFSLYDSNTESLAKRLIRQHCLYFSIHVVLAFLIAVTLSFAIKIKFFPILSLALPFCLMSFIQLHSQADQNGKQLQRQMPLLLSLLEPLLHNGFSLQSALLQCVPLWSTPAAGLGAMLLAMEKKIKQQQPVSCLFEQLAAGLGVSDSATACLLLARYDRLGHNKILVKIEQQTQNVWAEQRAIVRRREDARSGLQFIPMLMDLLAVMLIGVSPVLSLFVSL